MVHVDTGNRVLSDPANVDRSYLLLRQLTLYPRSDGLSLGDRSSERRSRSAHAYRRDRVGTCASLLSALLVPGSHYCATARNAAMIAAMVTAMFCTYKATPTSR